MGLTTPGAPGSRPCLVGVEFPPLGPQVWIFTSYLWIVPIARARRLRLALTGRHWHVLLAGSRRRRLHWSLLCHPAVAHMASPALVPTLARKIKDSVPLVHYSQLAIAQPRPFHSCFLTPNPRSGFGARD